MSHGPELLLVGGLGAIFLALGLGIGVVVAGRRTSAIDRGIATIGQAYAAAAATPGTTRRPALPSGGFLAGVGRLLTPTRAAGWMQHQLDYAGNPGRWPPYRVHEVQGLAAMVLGLVGGVAGLLGGGPLGAVVGLVPGVAVGLGLPLVLVYDLAVRRQEQLRRDLPDVLDLLTLSVEAGQGFDGALALVAARMTGPLAGEIARALQEMQMGMRRADAIRGLGTRTKVIELRAFCTAVVQAGDLGIPIAKVLREEAEEMRLKRRQYADEQARKVPVKIVVPLVLLLLPAIFIVVLGPGAIRIIQSGIFGTH